MLHLKLRKSYHTPGTEMTCQVSPFAVPIWTIGFTEVDIVSSKETFGTSGMFLAGLIMVTRNRWVKSSQILLSTHQPTFFLETLLGRPLFLESAGWLIHILFGLKTVLGVLYLAFCEFHGLSRRSCTSSLTVFFRMCLTATIALYFPLFVITNPPAKSWIVTFSNSHRLYPGPHMC